MSDFKAKMHQIRFWLGPQTPLEATPKGWLTPPCSKPEKYPGSRDLDHAPLGRNFSFLVGIPNTGQFSHTRVLKCT